MDEYGALREEIIARLAAQAELTQLTLIVTGAILAFRFGKKELPNAALYIQPPLVLLLSFGWAFNDFRIAHLGSYVRMFYEPPGAAPGWETFLTSKASLLSAGITGSLIHIQAIGVFVGTQIATLLVAGRLPDFGSSPSANNEREAWKDVSARLRRIACVCPYVTGAVLAIVALVAVARRFS